LANAQQRAPERVLAVPPERLDAALGIEAIAQYATDGTVPEPTEGLDDATARKILPAIRAAIPGALIILATHKPAEIAACDKLLSL